MVDVLIHEGSLPEGVRLGTMKTEMAIEDMSIFEVKESQSENRGLGWYLRNLEEPTEKTENSTRTAREDEATAVTGGKKLGFLQREIE